MMNKYSNVLGMLPKAGAPAQGKSMPKPPKASPITPDQAAPNVQPMSSMGAPVTPGGSAGGGMGGPKALPPLPLEPPIGALPPAPDLGGPAPDPSMPPPDPSMPTDLPDTGADQGAGSLADLKGSVDQKENAVATQQIISKNKLEGIRQEIIQNIFKQIKTLGVDPSDPASLSSFLQNMYQKDPDLYMLFESAFNAITGFKAPEGYTPGQPPAGVDMSGMMGNAMPGSPDAAPGGMPPADPNTPPTDPSAQFGGLSGALGQ